MNYQSFLEKYNVQGPRYTSYPTAPHFHESHSVDQTIEALSAPSNRPVSLYIHIPFCRSLCFYCGCNKIVTTKESIKSRYLDALHSEIDILAKFLGDDRRITHLHFGGGTPTYLSTEELAGIVTHLEYSFRLPEESDLELAIEIDPRTVDAESIEQLSLIGFNRMSFGIQDFDAKVQKSINRVQSYQQVATAITAARENDVGSISLDLLYGLPEQTVESFSKTLDLVCELAPDRLSLFSYAHIPSLIKSQWLINSDRIPAPSVKLALLKTAITHLRAAGFHQIGIDHFALETDELFSSREQGTLGRNFQGYHTQRGCDLVGLGMSSISRIGNTYSQNHKKFSDYVRAIEKGGFPVSKGYQMDEDDVIRADLIERIMCGYEVNFEEFGRLHKIRFDRYFADELEDLKQFEVDGLLEIAPDSLCISEDGNIFVRNIAMVFDRYLRQQYEPVRVRYSATV